MLQRYCNTYFVICCNADDRGKITADVICYNADDRGKNSKAE